MNISGFVAANIYFFISTPYFFNLKEKNITLFISNTHVFLIHQKKCCVFNKKAARGDQAAFL